MKKITAFLAALSICMTGTSIASMNEMSLPDISIKASAEETGTYGDLTYVKYDDYVVITGCDESATEVEIPSEIDGLPVTSIGGWAFYNCTNLTSITIPDSVTNIGGGAFCNCTSLTNITIPDSVTSIGSSAFEDCISLTSIIIPDSVTSIGGDAFYKCTSLTSIIIPDGVIRIGNDTFNCCTSLESITIPDSVIRIDNDAFNCCTSLTSITIPDSVTNINWLAFAGCSSLTSITILNPECEIYDDSNTICNGYDDDNNPYFNGTIYGYENSTAQAYAEKYGYTFVSLGEAPERTTTETELCLGDVNMDGYINIMDVIAINKAILGKEDLSDAQVKAADINGNDIPDAEDALLIMKYIVQLIEQL